jgi:hypothetical protein
MTERSYHKAFTYGVRYDGSYYLLSIVVKVNCAQIYLISLDGDLDHYFFTPFAIVKRELYEIIEDSPLDDDQFLESIIDRFHLEVIAVC